MLRFKNRLLTFNNTFGCIYGGSSKLGKIYFCDKKQIILEAVDKNKNSDPDQETGVCKKVEETLTFEDEEKVLKTVMLEKEKDASVRSRLSKECTKLLDKRLRLSSTGFNLRLDQNSTTNTSWENYVFAKTVDNLKKNTLTIDVEAEGVCKKGSQSNNPTNADGTPPASTNRIVRGEPGKVLCAFLPEEWFRFFIPKTGVTGFGTFLFTFGIYLVSKEYYVLEHNFYNGLGMFCVFWGAIKYGGPHISKYLDKEIDNYEKGWQRGRDENRKTLEEQINHEKLLQFQAEGELMLVEAKRENVHLQLEEEFRARQMTVYREVLKRLNYHVVVAEVYKKIFHRNLVDYVTREVRKSISPDMESRLIDISIDNLVAELESRDDKH